MPASGSDGSPLNVLLTTVGGKVSPSIIKSLKDNGERDVYLVGTDPVETVIGEFLVDRFYRVTACFEDEEAFLSDALDIVESEDIDVVMPCANEECLAFSKHEPRLTERGATLVSSDYETLGAAFDKYRAYEALSECAPSAAPEYHLVSDYEEFRDAAERLSYRENRIVLKPRHGRGGRGVLVLDPEMELAELLGEKPGREYPFGFADQLVDGYDWTEEFILMEYLPGDVYSAYALCDRGKTLVSVAHERLWGTASNTLKSRLINRDDVDDAVQRINDWFGFDYNVNYEFKTTGDGRVVMFDLNPRLAASTAVFRSVGINLPYLSVKLALGEKVNPSGEIDDDVIMMRYLQETYLNERTGDRFEI